jgi:hypothetical protein
MSLIASFTNWGFDGEKCVPYFMLTCEVMVFTSFMIDKLTVNPLKSEINLYV